MSQNVNLRIIIIDDNPDIHRDFIKILTKDKSVNNDIADLKNNFFDKLEPKKNAALPQFFIDTASSGQEGFEKTKKAASEGLSYALAFVDVHLHPGWNSIETIKHIWEIDPDMQIVICSAFSDYSWEETVNELGHADNLLILKKPFNNIAVRQLSHALIKKWQLLQDARHYSASFEGRVKDRTFLLEHSLSISRSTLESSEDEILVVNHENQVLDYNKKLIKTWNISMAVLEEKKGSLILDNIADQFENTNKFKAFLAECMSHIELVKAKKFKGKNNSVFEIYTKPYYHNEEITGRIWNFRDITKQAEIEERLEFQATHDALTGLPNRALMTDRLMQATAMAKRHKTKFAVLFFDLDGFKLINDILSHAAGDELLKELSKRVRHLFREEDTFSRLAGDEFVIISTISDINDANKIGDKVLSAFEKAFKLNNHEVIVRASIGISVYPTDTMDAGELMSFADLAMYRAKAMGGNQFQFYTEELGKKTAERIEKESYIRRGIREKDFFLVYQPQFVLREACQQNKKWQNEGLPKIRVAVNISNQQIMQPSLVEAIKNILQETGLQTKYLELELTENVMITSAESVNSLVELSEMGVYITLDDFGLGYLCINYLRTMPIDRVKIDKTFVKNISTNRGDEAILQAVIFMAKGLDLKVMAEGVETQMQLDFLKDRHCEEVQGYLFSKPLAVDDLANSLKEE